MESEVDALAWVDRLLAEAIALGASDIHLDPDHDGGTVRYRVDGFFEPSRRLERGLFRRSVGRLKLIGHVIAYREDIPQEGRIESTALGVDTDLRLSVMPTPYGEKAVVRLFHAERGALSIEDLGLGDDALVALAEACALRQGLVLVTGPCSSGKTTTLYAMLRRIIEQRGAHDHVVSIEDPVECRLPGVAQLEVGGDRVVSFAEGLRSLLRQDPQVMMVGEIRDAETAAVAAEAAFTGHLVLTSMHVGEPAEVVVRLLHMGVEPFVVSSALAVIVNQRLVRRLCAECAEPDPRPIPSWLAPCLGATRGRRGRGCEGCRGRGFRGRVVFGTAAPMTDELGELINARAARQRLAAAMTSTSLARAAADLVANGVTSVDELARVLGTPRSDA